jgi:serine/threonine protein kinase
VDPFGPYLPVRRLGAGAFGEVWEVRHQESGAVCALKTLTTLQDPEDRIRFAREAESLGRLNHPNVVRIHSASLEGQRPYLVQEFVSGGDLAQRLARGQLSIEDAVRIASELSEGLAAAHAAGILHRDLKPENVLLDPEGRPRLVDFGLARLSDASRLTETNTVMGTPVYMSPEQARGEHLDERSDVYALGALLFALLTGRAPFVNEGSLLGVLAAVTEKPAPRARALRGDVPAWLDALCARTLSKDPQERPASAAEFLRCLRDQALTTKSPGRNPWLWAAVWVGLVACATSVFLLRSAGSEAPSPSSSEASSSPEDSVPAGPKGGPTSDLQPPRWSKVDQHLPHSQAPVAASFAGRDLMALDRRGRACKWSFRDETWEREELFDLNLVVNNESQRPLGLVPWRGGWIAAVRFQRFALWRPGAEPRFLPNTSTCIAQAGSRVFLNFEAARYQVQELSETAEFQFESLVDIEAEALPNLKPTRNQVDGLKVFQERPLRLLIWTDRRVFRWSEKGGLEPLLDRSGEEKRGSNQNLELAPSRRRFAITTRGSQAFLVDVEGESPWRWLPVPRESVYSGLRGLAFGGEEVLYAVASLRGGGVEVWRWDLSGAEPRLTHRATATSQGLGPVSIDWDRGGLLAIGLSDGRVWLLSQDRLAPFRGEVQAGAQGGK